MKNVKKELPPPGDILSPEEWLGKNPVKDITGKRFHEYFNEIMQGYAAHVADQIHRRYSDAMRDELDSNHLTYTGFDRIEKKARNH